MRARRSTRRKSQVDAEGKEHEVEGGGGEGGAEKKGTIEEARRGMRRRCKGEEE